MNKNIFRTLLFIMVCGVVPISTAGTENQPIIVIVNNASGLSEVTTEQVRAIFLGKRTRVSGNKLVPINAMEQSPVRIAFTSRVLGMTPSEEKAYWENQQNMSGKQPPPSLRNTSRAVFSMKYGISYIFASEYKKGTSKIVLTIP